MMLLGFVSGAFVGGLNFYAGYKFGKAQAINTNKTEEK